MNKILRIFLFLFIFQFILFDTMLGNPTLKEITPIGQRKIFPEIEHPKEEKKPITSAEVTIGTRQYTFSEPVLVENDVIMIPLMGFLDKITVLEGNMLQFSADGNIATIIMDGHIVKVHVDTNLAETEKGDVDMVGITHWSDEAKDLYVSLPGICQTLGYKAEITTDEENNIYKARVVKSNKEQMENFINSKGLKSDTNYLIWIEKSKYSVSIFTKNDGKWCYVDSVACSIGADAKPTVLGEFKYFSREAKWDFGTYYVGPIMRFYSKYGIHSTLLKPDGRPLDWRLRQNISHGCIRIMPQDINWMVKLIPLHTKVFITK